MIIYGVSDYTEDNPFTEEKQNSFKNFFEPIEKKLKSDISELQKEVAEKYNVAIMPFVSAGEIELLFTIDMSTVRL